MTLNNLAGLYRGQERYEEAEPFYQRALAIFEKVLGPDHPRIARTLEDYAGILQSMNRPSEATALKARAKTIRAKHRP